jgi:hypothetical protein
MRREAVKATKECVPNLLYGLSAEQISGLKNDVPPSRPLPQQMTRVTQMMKETSSPTTQCFLKILKAHLDLASTLPRFVQHSCEPRARQSLNAIHPVNLHPLRNGNHSVTSIRTSCQTCLTGPSPHAQSQARNQITDSRRKRR